MTNRVNTTDRTTGTGTGHVALVTGGSRGIGRAVALRLGLAGYAVAVNYNAQDVAAAEVVDAIQQGGGHARAVQADVTRAEDVDRMISEVSGELGHIGILVNNAGIVRNGLLMRLSEDDWDAVMDTDLKSMFLCTKGVTRTMTKARWGRIINMSSVVGLGGNPGQANYAAAKAGIIGFTRAAAKELGSRGITVNAVAPGLILTDMNAGMTEEYIRKVTAEQIPLQMVGDVADVAAIVAFLASDDARYITGQVIAVDGGLTMQ